MASTRMGRIQYNIKRFLDFIRIFFHNKRGMLGVGIIIGYGLLVVGAPFITPYDSLGRDPSNPYESLSGDNVGPSWLKYIPPPLGDPNVSENIFINGTSEWNFTSTHPSVSLKQTSVGDGSLAITFRREKNESAFGVVTTNFTHIFYFPYSGPPKRFIGDIVLLAQGTTYRGKIPFWNETSLVLEYIEGD